MAFALNPDNGAAVSLSIYTASGEKAFQLERSAGTLTTLLWDCRHAAPGVYLVRVQVAGSPQDLLKVAVVH
jgi:hypothetical protein